MNDEKSRVRFEGGEDDESPAQSIWGGGAQDIEQSILRSTGRNIEIIGWKIISVTDVVGDLGSGSLQSISFQLQSMDKQKIMTIKGIALEVDFV